LEHHELDEVMDRAHRSSVQLMSIAGLVAGLLLGIGYLGLQNGSIRFAIGIWAVDLSLALALAVVARQLRGSATAAVEIGHLALLTRSQVDSAQAALTQRIGELQAQVQRLQADVDRYVRSPTEPVDAPVDAVETARVPLAEPTP
jgi:uncharacterized protein YlxW (UPF0749 family)